VRAGRSRATFAAVAGLVATVASSASSAAAPATDGFKPGGAAATAYRTTTERPRARPGDPLRTAVLAEVRAAARKLGLKAPEPDARLDRAMTDLARQVRGEDLPAFDVVEFLLAHHGLVEPSPHILSSHASLRGESELPAHSRDQIEKMLRAGDLGRVGVGVDRSGATVYLVIGLQERRVDLLQPIPRRLPAGGRAPIAARIAPGLDKPGFAITAPDGTVREQTPPARDRVVRGELRCAADGRYQVEIVASGAAGPTVLANFPVYCGVAPPALTPRAAGVSTARVTPEEAEKQMLALINRDRKRAGVPPLVADPKLMAVARAHTRDMIEHDFVGHVSPRTGTAGDRVRRAGLTPTLVSENVGRAYTAEEAQQGFMASPGHRANIVDRRPTRVGVGIVFGPPVTGTAPLFVTQIFAN
jgi:uncharacterized protein YkwD